MPRPVAVLSNASARLGALPRRHLFEFEDLPWLPDSLRDDITNWLQQCVVLRYDIYRATAPLIAELVDRCATRQVVDLCSGAGGPWPRLKAELEAVAGPVPLVLTDLFPNDEALSRAVAAIDDGRTTFRPDAVDARAVPDDLPGVRTLFTAVHHLTPDQVRAFLRDAFDRRTPVGAFDFCGRAQVGPTLRMGLRPMFATMRDVQPRRRSTLALTYLLPVVPAMILWDAMVSNLRAYSASDLSDMVADLQAPDWRWSIGVVDSALDPVTYITGTPQG
jgi:hypothetical protein